MGDSGSNTYGTLIVAARGTLRSSQALVTKILAHCRNSGHRHNGEELTSSLRSHREPEKDRSGCQRAILVKADIGSECSSVPPCGHHWAGLPTALQLGRSQRNAMGV